MGVSENRGTPKWMVKMMENPIKHGMIWGVLTHYFRKHPLIAPFEKYTSISIGLGGRPSPRTAAASGSQVETRFGQRGGDRCPNPSWLRWEKQQQHGHKLWNILWPGHKIPFFFGWGELVDLTWFDLIWVDLIDWLIDWLIVCLFACLLVCLFACLLVCLFACLLVSLCVASCRVVSCRVGVISVSCPVLCCIALRGVCLFVLVSPPFFRGVLFV